MSNGRKTLNAEGCGILCDKLRLQGMLCWIVKNFNWFKTKDSQKINSPAWNGTFYCINHGCCRYNAHAEINKDQVKLAFIRVGTINHDFKIVHNRKRITGEERARVALETMANGPYNTSAAEYKDAEHPVDPSSSHDLLNKTRQVHLKIKSEYQTRFNVSNSPLKNAQISKEIFTIIDSSSNRLKGYVQFLSADPFGFMLLSELQVIFKPFNLKKQKSK